MNVKFNQFQYFTCLPHVTVEAGALALILNGPVCFYLTGIKLNIVEA